MITHFSSLHCLFPLSKPSLFSLAPSVSFHPLASLMIPSASLRAPRSCTCRLSVASPNSGDRLETEPEDPVRTLRIGIIGFGNYGQFLAQTLISQGHIVFAHSRSDYSAAARQLGVSFFADPHDLCECHPDVILLCTSIISTEQVLRTLPFQRLRRNTLFVDVLSVKEFAKNLLLDVLPDDFDVLCTHPTFGPQSVRSNRGWRGLRFVYEKTRIGDEKSRISRCQNFLGIFEREGCEMVEMSCVDHDRYAAGSQFITHTVGRVLDMLKLQSTPINTKGYEALLDLVENTRGDSFDLYYGLFVYNKNSLEMLERMDLAFETLRKELFSRLHGVVRKQLFEGGARKSSSIVNGHQNAASLSAIRSEDAVRKYEYNAELSGNVDDSSKLKVAILGFGNFGQFLAKTIVSQGHTVSAYSRTDYTDVAQNLGVCFFSDLDDLCEEHPEVILLCTSILSTEKVLKAIPFQRLKRSTLFVDVLSVKEFPRNLFLQNLPPYFDILCTHPMFGPESGKNGWSGLSFVFDKVRIRADRIRTSRCDRLLDIFAREGCRMVEMTCAEHDWYAAGSQFITHTLGRVLEKLGLESTPVNTKGYETLLKLVENTAGDSFDLYYGLFLYNPNAMEQLGRLDMAFESLKKQLFGRLHGVLRKQLFGDYNDFQVTAENTDFSTLSKVDDAPSSLSEKN